MTDDAEMTPAKAEALGDVSAAVLQALFNAEHAHPDLKWFELAVATATAMRALAVKECNRNPELSPERADAMLMRALALALSLPREFVKIVKDNDATGPDQAGTIPVRRH